MPMSIRLAANISILASREVVPVVAVLVLVLVTVEGRTVFVVGSIVVVAGSVSCDISAAFDPVRNLYAAVLAWARRVLAG